METLEVAEKGCARSGTLIEIDQSGEVVKYTIGASEIGRDVLCLALEAIIRDLRKPP